MSAKQKIYLNLNNTTSVTQGMSLFNPQIPSGNVNSTNVNGNPGAQNAFTVDMTSELAIAALSPYPLNKVVTFYRPATGGNWIAAVATHNPSVANVTDVIDALNSLGLGTFTVVSGNNITVISSDYSFVSIAITSAQVASVITDFTFSSFGSLIYDPGFNASSGVGNLSQIDIFNPFWINPFTITEGPMNRNAQTNPAIQSGGGSYGFSVNINATVARTIYMGIGASHDGGQPQVYLKNDNSGTPVNILNMDAAAMQANITSLLGAPYDTPDPTFVFWNIYPVDLAIGNNFFQFFNKNDSGILSYSLAAELYDNNAAEIEAATSYADLTMLFRSSDYTGQNLY